MILYYNVTIVIIIINNRIQFIVIMIWSREGTIVLRPLRYNDNNQDGSVHAQNFEGTAKLWFYPV